MIGPLILLALLAALDVWTTLRALRRPDLHEVNPLLRWLMRHGRLWIVAKLSATALAGWLLRDVPAVVLGMCALLALVVWSNWRQAQ